MSSSSSEGGSSNGGNGGGDPTFTSGGGGGGGSRHGRGIDILHGIISFMSGVHGIGELPTAGFGGTDNPPLSPEEIAYICSVRRAFPRSGIDEIFIRHVARVLGATMGRDEEFLAEKLTDPQLCTGITAGIQSTFFAYAPEQIGFPTVDGFPYSSNPTWNACIRGAMMTLSMYTQLDESGRRETCADYRTGDWYRHPDLAIYFRFSRDTKELLLPEPYVARPLTATL